MNSNEIDSNDMEQEKSFIRLTKSQRIQHVILFVSTGLLIFTGFMLQGERWVIEMFGAAGDTIFWWRGFIHRVAGVAVTAVCLYHMVYVVVTKEGRGWIKDMMFRWKDAVDLFQNLSFMIGFRKERPKLDRFTYLEKVEYFSVWFGMFIVIVTGTLMWTEYLWPKFYLDISNVLHLGEATLAALAIIVGHIFAVHYNPHVYPMNKAFIDGKISASLMKAEHELWYERELAKESLAEGDLPEEDVSEQKTPGTKDGQMDKRGDEPRGDESK